jgi:hypothetical protein
VPAALEKGWTRYAAVKRLGLPWQNLATGFEPLECPAKLTDCRNRIRRLTDFRDNVRYSEPETPREIADFGKWFKSNEKKIGNDPKLDSELHQRVGRMGSKHEALAGVFDPTPETKVLVAEMEPVIQIAMELEPSVSTGALVQVIEERLVETQKALDTDGAALKEEFTPFIEAIASLRLFGENGGHTATTYLINCRDVNEVLTSHRAALLKILGKMRGAPHIDLGILNRVTRGTTNLVKLGAELDRKPQRVCVWATLGGYNGEEHAIKLAEGHPTVANEGCGTVFTFFGKVNHCGYPAVASAAVHGGRVLRDQRYNESEAGPMTHHWGPQSSKHLVGIDDLDTFSWDIDSLRFLAEKAGMNAITKHSNGVISPYLGRTLSSLENYRFIDPSRLATMLTGFIMAYLDVEAPARDNIPSVHRALCERAEEKFFSRFRGRDGFTGKLTPVPSGEKTQFDLALAVKSGDPIEKIKVIRRHKI